MSISAHIACSVCHKLQKFKRFKIAPVIITIEAKATTIKLELVRITVGNLKDCASVFGVLFWFLALVCSLFQI